jgi:hypothetical protein
MIHPSLKTIYTVDEIIANKKKSLSALSAGYEFQPPLNLAVGLV